MKKLNRQQLRKMILESFNDFNKHQQFREPGPGNIASVTLPTPVDQSSEYDISEDFYHDLLQMYMRSGNYEDAEKLKAKMLRLGINPEQGL